MAHLDPLAEIEHVWKQLLSPLSILVLSKTYGKITLIMVLFWRLQFRGFCVCPVFKEWKTSTNIQKHQDCWLCMGFEWYKYIHIYIYIHTYIYIHAFTYTHTYTCTYTFTYTLTYTYTYTYIYIHSCIYIYAYVYMYLYINIYIEKDIYMYVYLKTHTYIHTCIHTYIHTYTQYHTIPYRTVPYRTIPYHTNNHTLPARAAWTQEKQRLKFSHWLTKGT